MFLYTLDNKRYQTLNYFYRKKFNCKVAKIPLDAGLSCPNKLSGGCIYCKGGSKSNIINSEENILKQYKNEQKIYEHKWPNAKYIAYFQSGTNTFCDTTSLKKLCEPFLKINNCVGIAIATRPDSISNDCLNYLDELNKKTFLTVEIGLQSSNNNTLKLINRGHTVEDCTNCIKKLQSKNIFVVVHIINGLPGETKEDMINTVKYLNNLNINGIKIHMLHVIKDTPLETMYRNHEFNILSKDEYIDIVTTQLEYLNPQIVIERITGDPIKEDLVAPFWLTKKFIVLNDIDKLMTLRNIYQGDML